MSTRLRKSQTLTFGVLVPLMLYVLGSWVVLGTASGSGPSEGYRGMQLLFFVFPVGFVGAGLLNLSLLFAPVTRRVSASLLGSIFPALALVIEYAFLWHVGPFAR